jgi:hypothetical protein
MHECEHGGFVPILSQRIGTIIVFA